ncbi:lipoprotein [Streptomyces sp. NPDC093252]|uniref:lipoprotein n=1 Tax=Streptomyces sp. NPDC093252 TaxID=3154980 RepID=UPI00344942C2
MRVAQGARTAVAVAVVAAVVVAVTGCSGGGGGDGGGDDREASGAASAGASADAVSAAPATGVKSGGTLGGAGSACELPVTFDFAQEWKADPVEFLWEVGPVSVACEIDAKPAGHLGFVRVWTGAPGDDDPEAVLAAHLAEETGSTKSGMRYRPFEIDGVTAVEVTYTTTDDLGERPDRAFALPTPDGPVVISLDAPDADEHRAVLPAYELAKRTLRLAD